MKLVALILVALSACTTSEPPECEPPAEARYDMTEVPPESIFQHPSCGTAVIVDPTPLTWFVEATIDERMCEGTVDVTDGACGIFIDVACCGVAPESECYAWRGELARTEASRRPSRSEDAYEGELDARFYNRSTGPGDCYVTERVRIEAIP